MTAEERKRLDEDKEMKKPEYKGSYEESLDQSYEKLAARPAFQYDLSRDGLYRQQKDEYVENGRRAMKDSMGQAAALTGGYGSSYAQSAGQQRYDEHLRSLNDIVPELYQLAYQRYLGEGEQLQREHEALQQLRDNEYGSYLEELERFDKYQQQEYQRRQDEEKLRREQEQQEYQRALTEAKAKAGYGDFTGYAALYGQETADGMREYWISANPLEALNMGLIGPERYMALIGGAAPGTAQSGSSSRKGYSATAPDGRDAAEVQRQLRAMGYDIAVDGAWGPKSQAAWDKAFGASGGSVWDRNKDYINLMKK